MLMLRSKIYAHPPSPPVHIPQWAQFQRKSEIQVQRKTLAKKGFDPSPSFQIPSMLLPVLWHQTGAEAIKNMHCCSLLLTAQPPGAIGAEIRTLTFDRAGWTKYSDSLDTLLSLWAEE